MERIGRALVGILLAIVIAVPASSCDKHEKNCACRCKTIASLMMAIQSDNEGLRESAAFVLGEIKCTQAVIPLMDILHTDSKESTRIVAALALSLIGDARGAYAVKQAVVHDGSERVRQLCAYFYNEYVERDTFAFVPVSSKIPVFASE